MEEEEHEVYGGEIPDEGEMEGDMDSHAADVDMSAADDDAVKVLLFFFSEKIENPSVQFSITVWLHQNPKLIIGLIAGAG